MSTDYMVLEVIDPNPMRGVIEVGFGTPFSYVNTDEIYSVRRNATAEMFKLGDVVQHKTAGYFSVIRGFTVPDSFPDYIWFYFEHNSDAVKDLNNFKSIERL